VLETSGEHKTIASEDSISVVEGEDQNAAPVLGVDPDASVGAFADRWREPIGRLVRSRAVWMWVLIGVGALYLAIVARYFSELLTNTEINADASSAQVIGELYGHNSGTVYLGNIAWYSTLLFEWATGWLPAHHQIWDVGPYAIALCSIAVMGWTAWAVGGRGAAYITPVLLLCASPTMLGQMLWLNNHMTSYYSLALLAGYLVFLEAHAATMGKWLLGPLAAAVGLLVGVNMASDFLLVFVGPTSLMAAVVVAWRLAPSAVSARALVWSIVAVVVMGVTTVVTLAAMHSAQIYQSPFKLAFATSESIVANFRDWWESVAVLGNGSFFGAKLSISSVLAVTCAGLTVLSVLLIPRFAWKSLERWHTQRERADPKLSSYVVFWAMACTLLSLAFIFSSAPEALDTTRYLNGVIFAAAAIVPLWMARGKLMRIAVIAGTLVYCLTSINGVLRSGMIDEPTKGPTPEVAQEVAEVAERMHATQGYAVYWAAAPLTWFSHSRVKAYPFFGCGNNEMCPPGVNLMASWYGLPRNERTFLISEAELRFPPRPEFGRPLATYHFGTITMTVFARNIGAYIQ
jgi:hypothetical protein